MATETENLLNPATWVKSFGDYLYSYALLKVGNSDLAEDLVQDTFVSAIRGKDSFKGDSSEKTWLIAILKNKVIDYYRKNDVLKSASNYLVETEDDFTGHFFNAADGHWLRGSAPHAWSESADGAIHNEEFDRIMQTCIHKMPPKMIPVFIARFIDDEESENICKVYDISPSNYWVILHRAKVLLRSCLEKNWFSTKRTT